MRSTVKANTSLKLDVEMAGKVAIFLSYLRGIPRKAFPFVTKLHSHSLSPFDGLAIYAISMENVLL